MYSINFKSKEMEKEKAPKKTKPIEPEAGTKDQRPKDPPGTGG